MKSLLNEIYRRLAIGSVKGGRIKTYVLLPLKKEETVFSNQNCPLRQQDLTLYF